MKNIVACSNISFESICRENVGKYPETGTWMKFIFTKPVDHQPTTFLRAEIDVRIRYRPTTENWQPLLGKISDESASSKNNKKLNRPHSLSQQFLLWSLCKP